MGKIKVLKDVIAWKESGGKLRTAANYTSCVSKLNMYLGRSARSFRPEEVTPDWVEGYVAWLHGQHPDKPQTVDFYFRNLRAMCNHALKQQKKRWRDGVNPFVGTRIKNIRPSKRALGKEKMRMLLSVQFRMGLNDAQRTTLDVLFFILYMRGMVFKDLFDLRWDAVSEDGHVQYLRSKTGCLIDAAIPREAVEIMERYRRDDSPYVFPFLHVRQKGKSTELSEESALRRINRQAKIIGEKAGLSIPLTTYVMRHTWATLMLEAGKPVEIISQCLGHTSIRTTQIYLSSISVRRVDSEVNDMVERMLRNDEGSKGREKRKRKKQDNTHVEVNTAGKALPNTPPPKSLPQPVPQSMPIDEREDFVEEKSLFLSKKETILTKQLVCCGFLGTKVVVSNILTKFTTMYFTLFASLNF